MMADVAVRYFCHQCNAEFGNVTDDFCCPTCNSGFIEELSNAADDEAPEDDHNADIDHVHHLDFPGPLSAMLPSFLGMGMDLQQGERGRPDRYHVHRQGPFRPMTRGAGVPGAPNPDRHLENFLQELIFNVTGMGVAGGGGVGGPGISFHLVPGNHGNHMIAGEPGVQIHGNPGDYAWGRGGLDAIITQLLNQMDGAGPPPMAQESIKDIVNIDVTPGVLEKNPNCSVCLEDFHMEESVKQLECKHCFHKDCIVPWLELHGTCPVCRKVLNKDDESGENNEQDMSGNLQDSTQDGSSQGAVGGITGFIQNAFSSILGGGYSSEPPRSSPSLFPTSSASSASSTTTSASTASRPAETTTSDDDTPASRRQRLDSDFVDFDLE